MKVNSLAGKLAEPSMLVNVPKLVTAYYTEVPEPSVPGQRVAFGTSGHRGSANGALFTREDAVEAAWAVVDPVLETRHRAHPYKPGSWGPKQADALIAADGSWHNPILVKAAK